MILRRVYQLEATPRILHYSHSYVFVHFEAPVGRSLILMS